MLTPDVPQESSYQRSKTMHSTPQHLVEQAQKSLAEGDSLVALIHLENAYKADPSPRIRSMLAYCLAKERRQFQKARQLCQEALALEPNNPEHYFQLGRICLLARQKKQAIQTFRKGLKLGRYQPIIDELRILGLRKPPVFESLARDHFLNRSAGKLLHRMGKR